MGGGRKTQNTTHFSIKTFTVFFFFVSPFRFWSHGSRWVWTTNIMCGVRFFILLGTVASYNFDSFHVLLSYHLLSPHTSATKREKESESGNLWSLEIKSSIFQVPPIILLSNVKSWYSYTTSLSNIFSFSNWRRTKLFSALLYWHF